MRETPVRTLLRAAAVAWIINGRPVSAQPPPAPPNSETRIQEAVLDAGAVREVAVGTQSATTFQFPVPVRAVLGYGLTDGGDPSSSFQYESPEEMPELLVVRALDAGKIREAVMTVVLENRLFLFRLVKSDRPVLLIKLDGGGKQEWDKPRFGEVTPADTAARRIDFDEQRMLTLIRMARSWDTLKGTYPDWFEGAERRVEKLETDFGKVKSVISEVMKFRKDDAFVVFGTLENKTASRLYYDPAGMHLAAGQREYPVRFAEVTGEIEPKGKALFAVVVQGDSTGARAHLSIKNDLRLILPEVSGSPLSGPPALTEGGGSPVSAEAAPGAPSPALRQK